MNLLNLTEAALLELADKLTDRKRLSEARRNQESRGDQDAAAGRDAAYDALNDIEAVVTRTTKALDEAMADFSKAYGIAEAKRQIVGCAENAKNQALIRQQAAFGSLNREHGGGNVALALMRVQAITREEINRLSAIEYSSYNRTFADDGISVVWQSLKPEFAGRIPMQKARIAALEDAEEHLKQIEDTRGISPATVRQKVAAVLQSVEINCDDLT